MRRKTGRTSLAVLLVVTITSACCWAVARPPDPDRAWQRLFQASTAMASAYATSVPLVDPTRVADSAISIVGETLEVGLFALDFSITQLDDASTSFTGTIANLGDLPVTDVSGTIWLIGHDGDVVDWVDLRVPETSLQPGSHVAVDGRYVPGEHQPRLLEEALYIGDSHTPLIAFHPGAKVFTEATLDMWTDLFPAIRHEARWTTPSREWATWFLEITCAEDPSQW